MLRQLLILAKLVQTRLVFSCGTKHVQLICSLAKTKFPKFPTANWTRTTICIAASVGAPFAWVLVLPPGEALLLLFSDKLICISVTPPASSQPLSPPCCLSADCQKFIYLTPKKLTQTPVRRTTAYPGTPPHSPSPTLTTGGVACHEKRNPIYLPAPKLDYN